LVGRLPGLRLAVPASELEFKPGMAIHSLRELPVQWDEPFLPGKPFLPGEPMLSGEPFLRGER